LGDDYGLSKEMGSMPKERVSRGQPIQSHKDSRDEFNPVMCKEGKGVRNFACIHYDACLDKAAKGMWSGFSCRECCNYHQKEDETTSEESPDLEVS
jgi:hypothetical protein